MPEGWQAFKDWGGGRWSARTGPWGDLTLAGLRLPNPRLHPEDAATWAASECPDRGALERAKREYDRLKAEGGLVSLAMCGVTGVREFGDWAEALLHG